MNKKINSVLFLIFQFGTILCYSQENKLTTYKGDKGSKLNLSLNGQVKYLKEVTENLTTENKEEIEYYFDLEGLPTKIIKTSLGLDLMDRELRDQTTVFTFENGLLISELNKLDSGLDGYTYELDEKGNTIHKRFYVQNKIISEEFFDFDNQNRLIKLTKYVYGYLRGYNEDNPPIKSENLPTIETFEYDEIGNRVVETLDRLEDNVFKKKIFKFDSNSNKIEEGRCNNYSGLDSKTTCDYSPIFGWEYNEKSQLIKKFQLAIFLPHNTDTYYKYDENGNEIAAIGYYIYPDKEPIVGYHFNYEYNALGKKTKDIQTIGRYRSIFFEKYKTEATKFDKFQNIVLQEYITSDDKRIKVIRYEYSYDTNRNWTERKKEEAQNLEELKVTEIKKRDIEYYN